MNRLTHLIIFFFLLNCGLFSYKSKNYTYPSSYQISDFPLEIQPDEITCGPTSALMCLKYAGVDTTLEDVKSKTKTEWFTIGNQKIGMTSPDYLNKAIKSYGVNSFLTHGYVSKLKYYVSRDCPVIVLIRSGKEYWHYFVVTGYNESEFIIAEPANGTQVPMSEKTFVSTWAFLSDYHGNIIADPCIACRGDGYLLSKNFGPLGICDLCSGTGVQLDYMSRIIRLSDVNPFTMIVINTK